MRPRLAALLHYLVLTALAAFTLVPLVWAAVSSLRPPGPLFAYSDPFAWQTFVPAPATLTNYRDIFVQGEFGRAIRNSLYVSGATVLGGLLVNAMAGFAFAKFRFRGREALFVLVLVTFMVPFESIVVPLYLIVGALGWLESFAALIVPAVAEGLAIFLFRQHFAEIPDELVEAARIDGAGWPRIFLAIMLPLAKPALITVALMKFIFQWDSFFWPLVAAGSPDYVVAQVAIAKTITQEATYWGQLFASVTAASLVPMVLFLVLQKHYVHGLATSGLK